MSVCLFVLVVFCARVGRLYFIVLFVGGTYLLPLANFYLCLEEKIKLVKELLNFLRTLPTALGCGWEGTMYFVACLHSLFTTGYESSKLCTILSVRKFIRLLFIWQPKRY